jgi:hypothetical protein
MLFAVSPIGKKTIGKAFVFVHRDAAAHERIELAKQLGLGYPKYN